MEGEGEKGMDSPGVRDRDPIGRFGSNYLTGIIGPFGLRIAGSFRG